MSKKIGNDYKANQAYSHLRDPDKEWMTQIPSVVYRNSVSKWMATLWKSRKGDCGKPKIHKRKSKEGVLLTDELFEFIDEDGIKLFIGNKKFKVGELKFKKHRSFKIPKSVTVSRSNGKWFVSFCYDNGFLDEEILTKTEHLKYLQGHSKEHLEEMVVGVDRGVKVPLSVGGEHFDYNEISKKRMELWEVRRKRYQRKMARQVKGSNRRNKTKKLVSRQYEKVGNIRLDFAHQSTAKIVNSKKSVFVIEHLRTKNMTRRAKPKKDANGKYIKNGATAKSGLNKAILSVGWHRIESFLDYKSKKAGKVLLKIDPAYTSQECSNCGYTHPDNRKSQANFNCGDCGYTANADTNADAVIKKRAINLVLHPGTGLSSKGVLVASEGDTGRGGMRKTKKATAILAVSDEPSKKKAARKAAGSPRL